MTDEATNNEFENRKRELIWREAEGYAQTRETSRKLNKTRAKSRSNIEDGGIRTDAFQDGIRLVKDLDADERKAYMADLMLVLDVLGARQGDLFPEDVAKRAKAAEKAKTKGAKTPKVSKKAAAAAQTRTKADLDKQTDEAKRSNPGNGGAGHVAALPENATTKQTEEAIKKDAAALEQQEGEKILSTTPKSQSTIAAEKRDQAKLN